MKKYSSKTTVLPVNIARQLLELAQIKHEMCPITAEEFITGETAVLPCGHMFILFGLQETWKKADKNCCPACRQAGEMIIV